MVPGRKTGSGAEPWQGIMTCFLLFCFFFWGGGAAALSPLLSVFVLLGFHFRLYLGQLPIHCAPREAT